MRSVLPILAAAALTIGTKAWATQPPEVPVPPPPAGSWVAGTVDAVAHKAANFAVPYLRRGRAHLHSVDAVDMQVVAGRNFRLIMTLSDRSRWQVVVYQGLDQRYRFISKRRLRG